MPQHFVTPQLIVDRTQEDVDRVLDLISRYNRGETVIGFSPNLKGAYNYTDLNRIRQAMIQLAAAMNQYSYPITISTMKEFSSTELVSYTDDLQPYIDNLKKLRTILPVMVTTPIAPTNFDSMTYSKANDIEKLLLDIDTLLLGMFSAFHHSNATISGMGGIVV